MPIRSPTPCLKHGKAVRDGNECERAGQLFLLAKAVDQTQAGNGSTWPFGIVT